MLGLKHLTKAYMIWPKLVNKNLNKNSVFLINSRLSSAVFTGYFNLFMFRFDS